MNRRCTERTQQTRNTTAGRIFTPKSSAETHVGFNHSSIELHRTARGKCYSMRSGSHEHGYHCTIVYQRAFDGVFDGVHPPPIAYPPGLDDIQYVVTATNGGSAGRLRNASITLECVANPGGRQAKVEGHPGAVKSKRVAIQRMTLDTTPHDLLQTGRKIREVQ